ncbi:MAG: hypothetical protein QOF83_3056, partial [Solirubrobacteraceae bacterium]|nr:hypothetical protein [Solirubrobacteraceae bacterium]
MPARFGRRPLKSWRYVGIFGPELMICLASVRIGPARQSFWAVWDREARRLHERTTFGRGAVSLTPGRARAHGQGVAIDVRLKETAGIECICPSAGAYGWTRKQGDVAAHGSVSIDGVSRPLTARAVIDDTAAYYQRHTRWRWSAGVGQAVDGRALAWNLVEGVNDPAHNSERTLWIDADPHELAPARFAADLSRVAELTFAAEATRS